MEVVVDKRNHKHCPKCNGTNLYFRLNPLPMKDNLFLICANCDLVMKAKRETDLIEFRELAKEFK